MPDSAKTALSPVEGLDVLVQRRMSAAFEINSSEFTAALHLMASRSQ
jgi:hypothetical protein